MDEIDRAKTYMLVAIACIVGSTLLIIGGWGNIWVVLPGVVSIVFGVQSFVLSLLALCGIRVESDNPPE